MSMIVKVVAYQADWPQQFEEEAAKLMEQIGSVSKALFHIGSTSVPGLMAKPVIDILLEVHRLSDLDEQSHQLEKLGYEVMGENGIPGRRYFRKGGETRTHHIHAFQTGDPGLTRHLAFRDYLRAHPHKAQAYGNLIAEIAERHPNDIDRYCDEKDSFVKQHEALALEWYRA